MEDRILTLHPQGKRGVSISKSKYEAVRAAILAELTAGGSTSFEALGQGVQQRLGPNFPGSPMWYFTTVKLDLEARGLLERVPGSRPQLIRLADKPSL